MRDGSKALWAFFSNIAYTIGCVSLYVIALWIFVGAIWSIVSDAVTEAFTIYKLLDEVALIVFAIAVIDVCKYLMFEEVLRDRERSWKESADAFAKFVMIIATALSLEGLVLTIEMAKTAPSKMIFPILLFFTAAVLIVALGIYQKLSISAQYCEGEEPSSDSEK